MAFDSGGVASGPMTSTFLLPLCIGPVRLWRNHCAQQAHRE
ncbi:MAG: DUF1538 family protein [Eubacteriales bacterium]|nr:DUF1538 family protein [Eubacteriales bacterium]